jgi:hypothetical protein
MTNDDIWAAFETTPAPVEPVARRDNDLGGFQRRLLEECGYKLEELRSRYDALTDHHTDAERLLRAAYQTLHYVASFQSIPGNIGHLLEEMQEWLDG